MWTWVTSQILGPCSKGVSIMTSYHTLWQSFAEKCRWAKFCKERFPSLEASAALSKEFASEVSEQECRRRYGELCRPNQTATAENRQEAARKSIADGAGRAADGPPPDASAVKEVSQWFVRRIRQGNGQAVQVKQVKKTKVEDENPRDEQVEPVNENRVQHPISSEAQSLMGGSMLFAPPPRQPLDPIQLQNQLADVLPKGLTPAPRPVSKGPEGLHDLDWEFEQQKTHGLNCAVRLLGQLGWKEMAASCSLNMEAIWLKRLREDIWSFQYLGCLVQRQDDSGKDMAPKTQKADLFNMFS